MSENLKFKMIEAGIGELVLSQPKKRNALNAEMWAALPDVLNTAANTKGIKTLIVRGDGDHFASGADISEFETLYATEASARKISDDIAAGFKSLAEFPHPVVAQVRGACVGGGCGLSLCCDLRFADTTSKFAITPAKLGLVYPFSDIQRLIETVGVSNAKDILFSARIMHAEEALNIGLINRLLAPEELEQHVLDYARGLTALSKQSAITTKKMFTAHFKGQRQETIESEAWFLEGFSSRDFQEGYKAFLEKRKPDFK
jgi:enoyl-CoA hydratase/carnithine racemase